MHWLSNKLELLQQLTSRYEQLLEEGTETGTGTVTRKARTRLHDELRTTADEIASRPGIDASFVSHDGLLVASAGNVGSDDLEALAAIAGQIGAFSREATESLRLGEASQTVIIAKEGKLVILPIGPVVLGILSPRSTSLANALSK